MGFQIPLKSSTALSVRTIFGVLVLKLLNDIFSYGIWDFRDAELMGYGLSNPLEIEHVTVTNDSFVGGTIFEEFADIAINDRNRHVIERKLRAFNPREGNVAVLFMRSDGIEVFKRVFPERNKNRFILITHNSDISIIASEHTSLLNDPLLVRWYAGNLEGEHPKLTPIPIGIANEPWPFGDKRRLLQASKYLRRPFLGRGAELYVNFAYTHPSRQAVHDWFCNGASHRFGDLTAVCRDNGGFFDYNLLPILKTWIIPKPRYHITYLRDLGNAKFVISPPGNGIDCFRTWDSLAMGAIPIVLNTSVSSLYEGEQIIVVNDFKEVTPEFIRHYLRTHQKQVLPPKKLRGSYWLDIIKEERAKAMREL